MLLQLSRKAHPAQSPLQPFFRFFLIIIIAQTATAESKIIKIQSIVFIFQRVQNAFHSYSVSRRISEHQEQQPYSIRKYPGNHTLP